MRTGQNIKAIMYREGCRLPIGIGRVTGFAIIGKPQRTMIWIRGLIEIRLMAIGANGGCSAITVFMAFNQD